jgi:hypothetical protein
MHRLQRIAPTRNVVEDIRPRRYAEIESWLCRSMTL